MDVEAAARVWAREWSRAWPAGDADAVARLYADGARYYSQPFRPPRLGPAGARAYARESFSSEQLLQCWFGEPIAAAGRAAVEYWATLVFEGRDVTLAGCSLLRFDDDGRCSDHWDYWVIEDGLREPPDGWGTV